MVVEAARGGSALGAPRRPAAPTPGATRAPHSSSARRRRRSPRRRRRSRPRRSAWPPRSAASARRRRGAAARAAQGVERVVAPGQPVAAAAGAAGAGAVFIDLGAPDEPPPRAAAAAGLDEGHYRRRRRRPCAAFYGERPSRPLMVYPHRGTKYGVRPEKLTTADFGGRWGPQNTRSAPRSLAADDAGNAAAAGLAKVGAVLAGVPATRELISPRRTRRTAICLCTSSCSRRPPRSSRCGRRTRGRAAGARASVGHCRRRRNVGVIWKYECSGLPPPGERGAAAPVQGRAR